MTDADPSFSPPDFVYRLIAAADWDAAQKSGALAYSDIDERDGCFHLSTRAQALETARLYFAGHDDLLALEIAYTEICDACRWEPADARGGDLFPHYFGVIDANKVARAIKLEQAGDGYLFVEAGS
ncbi:MAG: DUF952 domain-containing protein [Pseudomonadota bacterium]